MRRVLALSVAALAAAAAAAGASQRPPAPPSGVSRAVLSAPPARTSIASQRIYSVVTDRYANGDPSNDRGGRTGGRAATGFDPTDADWFHGGDFRGLTGTCTDPKRGLARVKELGFTAVLITPPFGQRTVQGESAAYHGSWPLDFTAVDPHLGSRADFTAFVSCAHELGLKVYVDIVVNHTADVVAPSGGSAFVPPGAKPYRDCRGRPFNPARYVTRKFPCLTAARMPRIPVLGPGERSLKKPPWLNDVIRYHNRGQVDFTACGETCFEQGDVVGLDDLFTEQRAVRTGLANLYATWIRRYRLDGFRVGAARHVDPAFFRLWVPRILEAARDAGVGDFEIFGEVALRDVARLSAFVRVRRLPNVLDVRGQEALVTYAARNARARAITQWLAHDDYFQRPTVAYTPPTFLGDHTIGRAAYQIRGKAAALSADELLRRDLLGHSLMYLLRGAPVVYYGDEVGMIGTGTDRQARQDMFATQVPTWRTQERVGAPPIGGGSSFDVAGHPVAEHLKRLAALRDSHPALSTGASIVRLGQGEALVVSRIEAVARREYIAAFNHSTAPVRASFTTATPSSTWEPLFGTTAAPTSGGNGLLGLTLPPLSAVLLRAQQPIPPLEPRVRRLRIKRDDATGLWRMEATVGSAPVSVAFAVKRAGKPWRRIDADDSPPYRAFLGSGGFRRRELVHVVAIVRALDGRTAVSPVMPLRPRPR